MKKTRATYLIGFIFFPILIFGQSLESEQKIELNKIDSIVNHINETEKNYWENIIEGPIRYKNIFRKNGAWEAYILYENDDVDHPHRIIYNKAEKRTYEKFAFYYQNGQLIFAKLDVTFYRAKSMNKAIEKKFYFKRTELIYETNPELTKYNVEYIMKNEMIRAVSGS